MPFAISTGEQREHFPLKCEEYGWVVLKGYCLKVVTHPSVK